MVLLAGVEFVLTWVNREHGVRPAKNMMLLWCFFETKLFAQVGAKIVKGELEVNVCVEEG